MIRTRLRLACSRPCGPCGRPASATAWSGRAGRRSPSGTSQPHRARVAAVFRSAWLVMDPRPAAANASRRSAWVFEGSAAGSSPGRSRRRRRWSDSPATRSLPATASASVGGSARRRWSPTGCTPAPTASPRSRCCSAPPGWPRAGRWPTRSSAWSSPPRSCRAAGRGPRGLPPADGRRRPAPWSTQAEQACAPSPASSRSAQLRLRWIGHQLHADGDLVVRPRAHRGPGPPGGRRRRTPAHARCVPAGQRYRPCRSGRVTPAGHLHRPVTPPPGR